MSGPQPSAAATSGGHATPGASMPGRPTRAGTPATAPAASPPRAPNGRPVTDRPAPSSRIPVPPSAPASSSGPAGSSGPGRPNRPLHLARTLIWCAITAVVVLAFATAPLDWASLLRFPGNMIRYLGLMFGPPSLATLGPALSATLLSVQMAWFGTVLGVAVSLPLGFLATRGVTPAPVRAVIRAVLGLLRAVPEVVIAILILSVTGLTAFTGALAIAVGSIGTLGKWSYESMEAVDRGPIEAARAAGANRWQIVRWGVWTSAQPEVLAFWLYRFEISVRASAILGLIGAGGIGKVLADNVNFRIWDAVGMLLIVVVVVTVIIDLISGTLRRRLITGRWSAPRLRRTPVPAVGTA
ncbi:MAG TPA: phosphonate ABC transporter, permease protein PhnE [Nakamurella sp.]|nr:phosphonate ABC transporter, permease protein PhnE [Nakamurella sp.]